RGVDKKSTHDCPPKIPIARLRPAQAVASSRHTLLAPRTLRAQHPCQAEPPRAQDQRPVAARRRSNETPARVEQQPDRNTAQPPGLRNSRSSEPSRQEAERRLAHAIF